LPQLVALHNFKGLERDIAPAVIFGKGGAVLERKLVYKSLPFDEQCSNFCQSASQHLREADIVGFKAQILAGKKAAGSIETGLDFIRNNGNVGLALDPLEPFHKRRWQRFDTAFAQNRLDENRGNLIDLVLDGLPVGGIIHIEEPHLWPHVGVRVLIRISKLNGTGRLAMEGPTHCAKKALLRSFQRKMFYSGFYGFCA